MSSKHLLYLAERSSELFFVYDLTGGRFTYMNPTCISFFDLKNHDVRPKSLFRMVHPEDQKYVLAQLNASMEGHDVVEAECRIRRGKNERWLSITTFVSMENNEHLIIGQAEDITVIKEHSEVLHNHNNKKNSIITILAHDLAGPIGIVQSLSAVLGRETAHLKDPQIDRYLDMITRISKSNIHLIHDYLNQEFLESAGARLVKKRVDLVKRIEVLTDEYLQTQTDLKIQFLRTADREKIYVEIDEDKFMQVVNNLISNALKFTPEGGTISVGLEENGNIFQISVADTGIGIPQKFHATLFDKFTNARRSGLKGEHSTGLGMSIIKTVVEWHEGKIWFTSEENKGSTFFIEIPKSIEESF